MDLTEVGASHRRHPWELARMRFFRGVLADLGLRRPVRLLDVGAGDGWLAESVLDVLPIGSSVVCWDINYDDDVVGVGASAGPVARVRTLPAADRFDVALLLDVLEHVRDDEAFLVEEVISRLAPGATLIVSVPVHPRLYSTHDQHLKHFRRYRVGEIRALLDRHLKVGEDGSLFTSLLPLRALECLRERVGRGPQRQGVGAWTAGDALTSVITGVLGVDAWINRRLATTPVPVPGLSYWAVTRTDAVPGA